MNKFDVKKHFVKPQEPKLPPNMELVNKMSKEELADEYELIFEKKSKLSALQRDLVVFRYQYEELDMHKFKDEDILTQQPNQTHAHTDN